MDETPEKRTERIKELAKLYYPLPDGSLIEKHFELLRVFDVKGLMTTELAQKTEFPRDFLSSSRMRGSRIWLYFNNLYSRFHGNDTPLWVVSALA